ncbi:acyl-CoA reductase [Lachnoclostridium phytofermentans]|uniref:long-chain-fatty-acyl-CoA reductase n=1 Tax=Lachnoclostridium phytofermentans (strain ATCC 700394 / DSM 18823 / ISDg) TaxID=357809 RepID=A9KRC5_LACP7|nr:acyl-CoA reductase [Lachnoclostridium phytofermentans]ABX41999.1 acyl-CoA reductase [Lachnoclostridium phytofermentans ISDg]
MILCGGEVLESSQTKQVLKDLYPRILLTLKRGILPSKVVIMACHQLSKRIIAGEYQELLGGFLTEDQIAKTAQMLSAECLVSKIRIELGAAIGECLPETSHQIMPLGVLLHIAAGNMEGLPAYSVIEGLLAGNINIVKLPATDSGITIKLLQELISIEPKIKDYIYVFDTPSSHLEELKAMANMANGIVVWGGDETMKSIRNLASVDTRLIEWGHRKSFAYLTKDAITDKALMELATHIVTTKQILCSSCQGIYLDTDVMEDLENFCERFLPILESAVAKEETPSMCTRAQISLLLYHDELIESKGKLYRGKHCSLKALPDVLLTSSYTHANLWVRGLKRNDIIEKLHKNKGYLQTVGLVCQENEWNELSNYFFLVGATKVTVPKFMSYMDVFETHDGEYPLRRYVRIVNGRVLS